MRARPPDLEGFVERPHGRVAYEVFGQGEPAIFLLPTWQITDPAAYDLESAADDMLAVMDATLASPAVLVGFSAGCHLAVVMATKRPGSFLGLVLIGNGLPLAPGHGERLQGAAHFEEGLSSHEGWYKSNRRFWLFNYPDYIRFFMAQIHNEPHSTKQRVSCPTCTCGWRPPTWRSCREA